MIGSCSSPNHISSSSLKGGLVDVPSLEVTPTLAFSPASDALIEMPEVCMSFEMDLRIGTYGRVETVEVVGRVESENMGEDSGMEI